MVTHSSLFPHDDQFRPFRVAYGEGFLEELGTASWCVRPSVMSLVPLQAESLVSVRHGHGRVRISSKEERAGSTAAWFLVEFVSVDD